MKRHVIGASSVPDWLEGRLMPYIKLDGTTGIEFYGKRKVFELNIGDVLVKNGSRIDIERMTGNGES